MTAFFPYIILFLAALFISKFSVQSVKRIAIRFQILDTPDSARKTHAKPTPLLGGAGIFFSTVLILGILKFSFVEFAFSNSVFFAIVFGGIILTLGGALDDKFNISPKILWIFPALAAIFAISFGIGDTLNIIRNPFGGEINLNLYFQNFNLKDIFLFIWIMGMLFTTKFLDGLDGLCAGTGLVGSIVIAIISLLPNINQSSTAAIAIVFAGTLLGFLIFNYQPAKIFLGEGGSTFIGFMLAILSIVSGGKLATAFLVMGLPILDVAIVILKRIWKRKSPFTGDREHLHFKLQNLGITQKQIVWLYWSICAIFGLIAVFFHGKGKFTAIVFMSLFVVFLSFYTEKSQKH